MVKHRKWWLVAAITWMVIIFFFTQLPYFTGDNTASAIHKLFFLEKHHILKQNGKFPLIDELNFIIRKATHLTVFGILSFLLLKSLGNYRFSYLLAWVLTFFYAMTDEWHQSFVPNRTSSFKDVLIDATGALIVLVLTFFIRTVRKKSIRLLGSGSVTFKK